MWKKWWLKKKIAKWKIQKKNRTQRSENKDQNDDNCNNERFGYPELCITSTLNESENLDDEEQPAFHSNPTNKRNKKKCVLSFELVSKNRVGCYTRNATLKTIFTSMTNDMTFGT
jgi:hypothetical protein